jgi:hypothetical protein
MHTNTQTHTSLCTHTHIHILTHMRLHSISVAETQLGIPALVVAEEMIHSKVLSYTHTHTLTHTHTHTHTHTSYTSGG